MRVTFQRFQMENQHSWLDWHTQLDEAISALSSEGRSLVHAKLKTWKRRAIDTNLLFAGEHRHVKVKCRESLLKYGAHNLRITDSRLMWLAVRWKRCPGSGVLRSKEQRRSSLVAARRAVSSFVIRRKAVGSWRRLRWEVAVECRPLPPQPHRLESQWSVSTAVVAVRCSTLGSFTAPSAAQRAQCTNHDEVLSQFYSVRTWNG